MALTVFIPSKQGGSFAFQSLHFVLIFNRKHSTSRKDELNSVNIFSPWNKPEFFFLFDCMRGDMRMTLFFIHQKAMWF